MNTNGLREWIGIALRLGIGAVFVVAGALKWRDPLAFADSIASFQLLPRWAIGPLALWLPVFEVAVGGMLVSGWRWRQAALGVVLMTGVFALALGSALARGLTVDCGCFGGGEPSAWKTWGSLGRDLVLLAGGWWIARAEKRGREADMGLDMGSAAG